MVASAACMDGSWPPCRRAAQAPHMPEPESAADEIALFPLHTVLFPGGPLPLRIFEARYIDMVRRSLRAQTAFGVVLIEGGEGAGAVTATAAVGTTARLADFYSLPDG